MTIRYQLLHPSKHNNNFQATNLRNLPSAFPWIEVGKLRFLGCSSKVNRLSQCEFSVLLQFSGGLFTGPLLIRPSDLNLQRGLTSPGDLNTVHKLISAIWNMAYNGQTLKNVKIEHTTDRCTCTTHFTFPHPSWPEYLYGKKTKPLQNCFQKRSVCLHVNTA